MFFPLETDFLFLELELGICSETEDSSLELAPELGSFLFNFNDGLLALPGDEVRPLKLRLPKQENLAARSAKPGSAASEGKGEERSSFPMRWRRAKASEVKAESKW